MKYVLNKKGFTLVELMISITILSLVIFSLYGLLETGMYSYKRSDAHLEQVQHLRIAMEKIGRDLRAARSVKWENNTLKITLESSNDVQYYLGTESIYGPSGLSGSKLSRNSQPVASYLKEFSAKNKSGNNVLTSDSAVVINLTAENPEGKTVSLTNTFYLRNKQ